MSETLKEMSSKNQEIKLNNLGSLVFIGQAEKASNSLKTWIFNHGHPKDTFLEDQLAWFTGVNQWDTLV